MNETGRRVLGFGVLVLVIGGGMLAGRMSREAENRPPTPPTNTPSARADEPRPTLAEMPEPTALDYLRATAPLAFESGPVGAFGDAVTRCIEDVEEGARTSAVDSASCVAGMADEASRRLSVARAVRAPADIATTHARYVALLEASSRRVHDLATLLAAEAPALDRARRRRSWQSMWAGEFEIGPSERIQALSSAETETYLAGISVVQELNAFVMRRLACVRRANPARTDCDTWRGVVDSLRGETVHFVVVNR